MNTNNLDLKTIIRQFDQYVEGQIFKKNINNDSQIVHTDLKQYYLNFQKKFKIKTLTQDQKFQNMLGPITKLRSFVSIKQFLKFLNRLHKNPSKIENQQITQEETKQKLKYENLRGVYFLEKVENHLRKYNIKRKLDDKAEFLLKELEQCQSQKNQYRNWMQSILDRINMKQQEFLKQSEIKQYIEVQQQSKKSITLSKTTNKINSNKKSNQIRKFNHQQEQKNCFKVSQFLAENQKKIFINKYIRNSTKQRKTKFIIDSFNSDNKYKNITQSMSSDINFRQLTCKTAAAMTTNRTKLNSREYGSHMRARTTEIRSRRIPQDMWKKSLNIKMDEIMSVANDCYKKCQQDRRQYKKIINPYCVLVQDESKQQN